MTAARLRWYVPFAAVVLGAGAWLAATRGWKAAALALPFLALPLAVEAVLRARRRDLTEAEGEALTDELMQSLLKELPLEKYVQVFGPLHWKHWVACLHRRPDAQRELQALLDEAGAGPFHVRKPLIEKILAIVEREPDLKRRVRREYHIQLLYMLRPVLFGRDLPDPAAKHREWPLIYERLQHVLARHAKPDDYYLVGDEVAEPGHMIELRNPDVLTPAFLADVQAALKGWKNAWYVILELEFEGVSPDLDPAMLTVWEDHVDEAWDREQARAILGSRFRM